MEKKPSLRSKVKACASGTWVDPAGTRNPSSVPAGLNWPVYCMSQPGSPHPEGP